MAVFLKMEESLRWRKLEDGGILNMTVSLNIKDGGILNMTKVCYFMERGGRVVR
jgi:hypothetical protein